jgi:hypothetical protein
MRNLFLILKLVNTTLHVICLSNLFFNIFLALKNHKHYNNIVFKFIRMHSNYNYINYHNYHHNETHNNAALHTHTRARATHTHTHTHTHYTYAHNGTYDYAIN